MHLRCREHSGSCDPSEKREAAETDSFPSTTSSLLLNMVPLAIQTPSASHGPVPRHSTTQVSPPSPFDDRTAKLTLAALRRLVSTGYITERHTTRRCIRRAQRVSEQVGWSSATSNQLRFAQVRRLHLGPSFFRSTSQVLTLLLCTIVSRQELKPC